MAKNEPVVLELATLPREQVGPFLLLGLDKEFRKLRRITGKCLPLVKNDEQRRVVRDLADHIDKKMEVCRSMGA